MGIGEAVPSRSSGGEGQRQGEGSARPPQPPCLLHATADVLPLRKCCEDGSLRLCLVVALITSGSCAGCVFQVETF